MFNNIFKYRKNNKNIIIGLLILVIGIFITTDILKKSGLFKFREGNAVQNHMEDDDVYIDCNPVDSEGVELVTVSHDTPTSSGAARSGIKVAEILRDNGVQFIIGIVIFLLVYNIAQRGFKFIGTPSKDSDRLFGGSLNKLN